MRFFDSTPLGRILNRFSKDLDSVDNSIPPALSATLHNGVGTLASVIVVSTFLPWFLVAVVVVAAGFIVFSVRSLPSLSPCLLTPLSSGSV